MGCEGGWTNDGAGSGGSLTESERGMEWDSGTIREEGIESDCGGEEKVAASEERGRDDAGRGGAVVEGEWEGEWEAAGDEGASKDSGIEASAEAVGKSMCEDDEVA